MIALIRKGDDTTTSERKRLCRSIFLTVGSAPRRGRRVLPVTLGRHYKPFGSAGTARGLRALDLVGAAPRTLAQERHGRAKKASIRMGERYATGPTSVFRGGGEG